MRDISKARTARIAALEIRDDEVRAVVVTTEHLERFIEPSPFPQDLRLYRDGHPNGFGINGRSFFARFIGFGEFPSLALDVGKAAEDLAHLRVVTQGSGRVVGATAMVLRFLESTQVATSDACHPVSDPQVLSFSP